MNELNSPGVELDGNVSYLENSPLLERIGLRVHTRLRVLLCIACASAFTPTDICGHLKERHDILLSQEEDQAEETLQEVIDHYGVVTKAVDGPLPTNRGPPVELVVIHDGYACGHPDCLYAAPSKDTVNKHRRTVHSIPQNGSVRLESVKVQTLFTCIAKHYFIVNPTLVGVSTSDPFSILLNDILPPNPLLTPDLPTEGREIPPFHRVTRWWDILGDHILTEQLRKPIIELASTVNRNEPALYPLSDLCRQYLKEAQKVSQKAGYTVRKKLVPEE